MSISTIISGMLIIIIMSITIISITTTNGIPNGIPIDS
jgi:hypothetical protein